MKTEKQIAEEKIKLYKKGLLMKEDLIPLKEKDQRFLEFLEGQRTFIKLNDQDEEVPCCKYNIVNGSFYCEVHQVLIDIENKITDLKQAIKLYEDAGI